MLANVTIQDESLELLTQHCVAARGVIDESGTLVMRRLIDLLLFEIGVALAERTETRPRPIRRD